MALDDGQAWSVGAILAVALWAALPIHGWIWPRARERWLVPRVERLRVAVARQRAEDRALAERYVADQVRYLVRLQGHTARHVHHVGWTVVMGCAAVLVMVAMGMASLSDVIADDLAVAVALLAMAPAYLYSWRLIGSSTTMVRDQRIHHQYVTVLREHDVAQAGAPAAEREPSAPSHVGPVASTRP